jgi:hypothetical protein
VPPKSLDVFRPSALKNHMDVAFVRDIQIIDMLIPDMLYACVRAFLPFQSED